ncbi:Fe-S-containing hydro-lyase [Desulfomonile tiedjei]|uniref:Hydro-lyase family enzyme, Fe-S type, tartrate/fumarate subfamily n=1 Tax=Desulfomonile tiedjei (strain ATCC 49306 / DSM 6799 / DCB-1) TaxID=706587 RepID=I4CEX9_DESTA|nr:Fe-S-containing hydro-lyase [Desulfomonile tiedjei]AFM28120.1 hydro-lyase family enzyme, Fe-S type, tartrate/fumarate subfamily [Desulfomonile tiedjei DSM 6799]
MSHSASDISEPIRITAPLDEKTVRELRAGDTVLLSGTIITGRDAAHKRMVDLLNDGKPLPFDIKDQVIYYVGPSPAPPGSPIGAAGPTTSYRMDAYAPLLIEHGLRGMIGKGQRSDEVKKAMIKWGAVYFAAVGGTGALISRCIQTAEILAWEDLGTEAVRRLTIKEFPAIVAVDSTGNDLYLVGRNKYRK